MAGKQRVHAPEDQGVHADVDGEKTDEKKNHVQFLRRIDSPDVK
jgi:hypothetical protein